jgi:hypothetical protein
MRETRHAPAGRRAIAVLTAILFLAAFGVFPPGGHAAKRKRAPQPVAVVKVIKRGLSVQPPQKRKSKGHVKEALFGAYALRTAAKQLASLGFRDGTVLHMNQKTDAVLRSPSVTKVNSGEIDQQLAPGSNHQIQTVDATASAIGTNFDVRIKKKATILTVLEGAVLVKTKHGSVTVKTGEQTTVKQGKAPTKPKHVSTSKTLGWAAGLPMPPVGNNAALDSNGGAVKAVSSTRPSSGGTWSPHHIIDGSLNTSWQSAPGAVHNQTITLDFSGHAYTLSAIVLDCAPTGGEPAADAMNHFDLSVSSSGTTPGDFTQVLSGACSAQHTLTLYPVAPPGARIARFAARAPARARYVRLTAVDNHGGAAGIAIAELEVVTKNILALPTPGTPTPTAKPTTRPRATPTRTATSEPATSTPPPTTIPTAGTTPIATPAATPTNTPTAVPTATSAPVATSTACIQPACFAQH